MKQQGEKKYIFNSVVCFESDMFIGRGECVCVCLMCEDHNAVDLWGLRGQRSLSFTTVHLCY